MNRSAFVPLIALIALVGCEATSADDDIAQHEKGRVSEAENKTAKENHQDADLQTKSRLFFDELVEVVRKYHVFTEQTEKNLGYSWEEELVRLEEEFAAVDSEEDLLRAIHHLGNSLHNPHCLFSTPDRPVPIHAGFDAAVDLSGDVPEFYVEQVNRDDLREKIQTGDRIMEVDGIEAKDFLVAFFNESNANNRRSLATDIANFLTHRMLPVSRKKTGDVSHWLLQSRASGATRTVETKWRKPDRATRTSDPLALDLSLEGCAGLPAVDYGPYSVALRGNKFCVYSSNVEPFNRFPVVRFFSFYYREDDEYYSLKLDHEHLKKFFADHAESEGIVLDLRDNLGGRNPNWFLDWFASKAYTDMFVRTRMHEDLLDEKQLDEAHLSGWGKEEKERYLRELKSRKPDQEYTAPKPFFCPDSGCDGWDNVYHPKHQISSNPVALLTGPRCLSSCDHLTSVFSEYGMGVVIGQTTASGFTSYRLRHKLGGGDPSVDMGFLYVAFSDDISGKTGKPVEAVPIRIDVPVERTYENRAEYDRLLVKKAIEAIEVL